MFSSEDQISKGRSIVSIVVSCALKYVATDPLDENRNSISFCKYPALGLSDGCGSKGVFSTKPAQVPSFELGLIPANNIDVDVS